MSNLKAETIEVLWEHGLTTDDVLWAGTTEFYIDLDLFWTLADREYDSSYGAPEVAQDLIVVGAGWWLERHEYDGSEWWEFKSMPTKPPIRNSVQRIITDRFGWDTLKSMNRITENGGSDPDENS